MNLSTEQKQTHGHRKQTWGCRGGGSRMDWEFGVNRCFHLEWINRSSPCGTAETKPTRNHEVVGSNSGLAQRVKDPALLQAGV